jgi:hypothetical protein
LSDIARLQIGREKHGGMAWTLRTGWYSKPAATMAASLMLRPGLELPIENAVELLHRTLLGVF